jgi:hypothetical protein|tara:strand:+ start:504 stop:818 length:315 start_codon:yes stop_codon:yes gene_type:complete
METYAERIKRIEKEKMSNYDMDEIERQRDREKRSRGIVLQDSSSIEIDLDKGDALKLALQAHDKKVTLNQHIIDVLTDQLLIGVDAKELLRNAPRGKQELLKEY